MRNGFREVSGTTGGGAAVVPVTEKVSINVHSSFKFWLIFICVSHQLETYGLKVMPSTAIPFKFAAVAGS